MQKKEVEGIGTLFYNENGSFIGKVKVDIFSNIYEIDIRFRVFNEGYNGLSNNLIVAAQNCLRTLNSSTEIAQLIKKYYDRVVREKAEDEACDYIKFDNENGLAQVMKPKEIYLMKLKKTIVVGIYFECDWDDEGFAIRFSRNGKVKKMGTGDIIY